MLGSTIIDISCADHHAVDYRGFGSDSLHGASLKSDLRESERCNVTKSDVFIVIILITTCSSCVNLIGCTLMWGVPFSQAVP